MHWQRELPLTVKRSQFDDGEETIRHTRVCVLSNQRPVHLLNSTRHEKMNYIRSHPTCLTLSSSFSFITLSITIIILCSEYDNKFILICLLSLFQTLGHKTQTHAQPFGVYILHSFSFFTSLAFLSMCILQKLTNATKIFKCANSRN